MDKVDQDQDVGKNAFKALRQLRKREISEISKRVKRQRETTRAIMESLKNKDATVPEIAQATGIPPHDVLWYLATLKKYGAITEAEKEGSYYRYDLSKGKSDASTS